MTYIDDDDPSYDDVKLDITWHRVGGARHIDGLVNLSAMWNRCYEESAGDIVMHCGDDIVFRTAGWDAAVVETFARYPDNILFAFGRDGIQDGRNFGTHGFLHRDWIEAVGFFVPPYFVSDFNDTFLNDVADLIGRKVEIDIYTEHLHWTALKAEKDRNTLERLVRHAEHRPDLLYQSEKVQAEIAEAAQRLRAAMA